MRFIADKIIKQEPIVKLTIDDSSDNGIVFIRANGKTIMGFYEGEYCLYSDAGHHDIEGVKFDNSKFIKKHEHTF